MAPMCRPHIEDDPQPSAAYTCSSSRSNALGPAHIVSGLGHAGRAHRSGRPQRAEASARAWRKIPNANKANDCSPDLGKAVLRICFFLLHDGRRKDVPHNPSAGKVSAPICDGEVLNDQAIYLCLPAALGHRLKNFCQVLQEKKNWSLQEQEITLTLQNMQNACDKKRVPGPILAPWPRCP